jgi:hypothetical protein
MADDQDRKRQEREREDEMKRKIQEFIDNGGTFDEAVAMLNEAYRANDNSRDGPKKS